MKNDFINYNILDFCATSKMNLNVIIRVLFEKNRNVFLTGIGGCGKSYLVKEIKQYCKEKDIVCSLTSTTGVSSYSIGGQTIHSWSGIVFNKTDEETVPRIINRISKRPRDKKRIMKTQLLIIDEISMLGGTYLEVMDYVFKAIRDSKEVFGGMRILFTGDFMQLPPVNDVYAFQSVVWNELNLAIFELTVPKRFDDPEFAEMLLRIRRGEQTADDVKKLEERHEAYKLLDKKNLDDYTILMSKKSKVSLYNNERLSSLQGMEDIIVSLDKRIYCDDPSLLNIDTLDMYQESDTDYSDFDKYFMAPNMLKVRPNCRIMIIQNIDQEAGIVNGTRGTFLGFTQGINQDTNNISVMMRVKLDNGLEINLEKMLMYQQFGDELFVRVQYPIILSYALTIHKCQGLTLTNVIINAGKDIFEAGQAYVALSRCRNLSSLYLSSFSGNKLYCDSVSKKFEDKTKRYKLK